MSRPRPSGVASLLLLVLLFSKTAQGATPTDEKSLIHEITVLQCIHVLQTGDVGRAYEIFQELDDELQLTRILHDAHESNVKNIQIILSFLKKLSSIGLKEKGYEVLYQDIKNGGDPSILRAGLLLLQYQFEEEGLDKHRRLSTLSFDIKSSFMEVVNVWASNIRKDALYEIKKYKTAYSKQFNKYVYLVIDATYAKDLNNVDVLAKCISSLSDAKTEQYDMYKYLIAMMKINSHLHSSEGMRLAFKIKKNNKTNTQLNALKSEFTEGIQAVVWGNCILTKTQEFNEYLYAAYYSFAIDSKHRTVFTWISGGSDDTQYHWNHVYFPDDDNFELKNHYYNEFLFGSFTKRLYTDKNVYGVYTLRREDTFDSTNARRWKIEPVGTTGLDFHIRNVGFNQFIGISADQVWVAFQGTDRRHVELTHYGWRSIYWMIEKCK